MKEVPKNVGRYFYRYRLQAMEVVVILSILFYLMGVFRFVEPIQNIVIRSQWTYHKL